MKIVGRLSETLLAPADLRRALKRVGKIDHFDCGSMPFRAGDKNTGVFLVWTGKVSLQVPGAPQFDRTFSVGSVLGLPSSFIGKPYSLTAVCITDCTLVHVSKKKFLDLMTRRLDLCREATDILSHEVAFILSALGKDPRETRLKRSSKTSLRSLVAGKNERRRD
jgi:CRP-like cAMP-binding protein